MPRPPPRTKPFPRRAARRCSAPTNHPNFTELADKAITAEAVTRKQAEGNTLAPYSRRHGLRRDAFARRSLGQAAQGVHAHLRKPGNGPRPRPVLVQLLRLRRHPRAGQHLLPKSIEEGAKAALESKAEIVAGPRRRRPYYAEACSEGQGAARRQGDPRGRRAPACTPELEGTGHHELHQREIECPGKP